MAINNVLPLKAARRDAIANLKCFGTSHTRDLTSMVTFTFSMRRRLIRLASAPCISFRLATFGWVRFLRATRGKHNAEFTKGGWELWSYFNPFVDQFHEIFRRCSSPLYFPMPFSDCLCHVLFRRYLLLNLKVVEKRSRCKSFLAPNFVGVTAATSVRQFVTATYYPLLGKVWLSSICWSPSAKPDNEAECKIYEGWVKMALEFEAVCGSKFMTFWDDVGDTL